MCAAFDCCCFFSGILLVRTQTFIRFVASHTKNFQHVLVQSHDFFFAGGRQKAIAWQRADHFIIWWVILVFASSSRSISFHNRNNNTQVASIWCRRVFFPCRWRFRWQSIWFEMSLSSYQPMNKIFRLKFAHFPSWKMHFFHLWWKSISW